MADLTSIVPNVVSTSKNKVELPLHPSEATTNDALSRSPREHAAPRISPSPSMTCLLQTPHQEQPHRHSRSSSLTNKFRSTAIDEAGTSRHGTSGSSKIDWGVATLKGHRSYQQDAFVVGEPSGLQDTLLFGVFDGHGPDGAGSRIARTTASELHRIISKRLSAHEVNDDHNNAVHTLLRKAFIEFDEYLSLQNDDSQVKEGFLNWLFGFRGNPGYHHAGTCAVIALVGPTKVYIASIGDSRAITSKGGHITRLHRASESDEAERIYWNGGFIADNRVNGELIPTRAFGDFRYKSGGTHDCHIVSCLPEVIDVSREQIGSYLILGSDGVFDILTPAQVLSETTDREQLVPPEVIAQSIVDHAVHLGSKDNVTCVVIHLGSTETASE